MGLACHHSRGTRRAAAEPRPDDLSGLDVRSFQTLRLTHVTRALREPIADDQEDSGGQCLTAGQRESLRALSPYAWDPPGPVAVVDVGCAERQPGADDAPDVPERVVERSDHAALSRMGLLVSDAVCSDSPAPWPAEAPRRECQRCRYREAHAHGYDSGQPYCSSCSQVGLTQQTSHGPLQLTG